MPLFCHAPAFLINIGRGVIVKLDDLVTALRSGEIAGAGLDVFEQEPLPPDHPFRSEPRILATPHIGYVTRETYRVFYGDAIENMNFGTLDAGNWMGRFGLGI